MIKINKDKFHNNCGNDKKKNVKIYLLFKYNNITYYHLFKLYN